MGEHFYPLHVPTFGAVFHEGLTRPLVASSAFYDG